MKNQILDTPFRDSFEDFLEKGETINWQATALQSDYAITPTIDKIWGINKTWFINGMIGIISILVFIIFNWRFPEYGNFIFPMAIFLLAWFTNRKKFTSAIVEYAITSKRVLFKSNYSKKRKIYEIPFSEMKNIIIVKSDDGFGTIFLAVKNPKLIPFETHTKTSNNEIEKRHQPTLENVKNVEAVAELIREGIQNAN